MINNLEIILAYERKTEMLELVREYTDSLIELGGDEAKNCLAVQHIDDELNDMEKKYAPPFGRMYLALVDGNAAGCVAFTKNDNDFCEIKRLYVRPQFRRRGISKALVERVINDAKNIGYKHVRLDTLSYLQNARKLYEKCGFYRIEKYNDNPAPSAMFMQLDL